jgi:antitoxin CptB
MDLATRKRRLRFRAWHRGTKEADLLIGSFFDREQDGWDEAEVAWYESLMEEDDVDVMAWAIGTQPVPARYRHAIMAAMQRLDYLPKPE